MEQELLIHPTAVVDEGARVGAGTRIWHFSHLMKGCIIGSGCTIGQNVFIDTNVTVGNNVKIQNNVSVYNRVTLEDEVFIGPSAVFTNVINPRSFIDRKHEFLPTLIRKGATIGANATLVCGIEVGAYAMVGAGSVVTRSVPSYALVYGNPAQWRGWVSKGGYSLTFGADSIASCPASGERYILQNGLVFPEV